MTIPPLSLGLSKGAERAKLIDSELFEFGQAHGHLCKSGAHTLVHALAGRLQAGPAGNLELTVPASLIKGVFDALDEPGAEFVVRNNRTESAIKVMTKEEVDKLGGINHITERGHSYHYTLGPIVEMPASGEYDKLWAISIKSEDLEDIRKSYGLETSPQLGFFIPVGCKKKHVTKENNVSKLGSLLSPNKNWNPPAYHKISPADDSFNTAEEQFQKDLHDYVTQQGFTNIQKHHYEPGGTPWSMLGKDGQYYEIWEPQDDGIVSKPELLVGIYGENNPDKVYRKGPGLVRVGDNISKLASLLSQDEVYNKFVKDMGKDYEGKLEHVSGGLPDARGVSDVDVGYMTPDYKNLLSKLPKGTSAKHKDNKSIYRIPGYEREVGLLATDDPSLIDRSKTHREHELALALKYPDLAAAAANLKKSGMGTEEAWANVLGLSGDPYEAMLDKSVMSRPNTNFNKTAQQPIIPSRVGVGSPYYDPKNVLGTQPPSNFNFSNTPTPTQKSYNRPSFPTYQPGPNYERGDERRNAWPGKPGWIDDRYRPFEEAPLQSATSDLSFTTPLAGYSLTRGAYSGLKSLANLPKAVGTASKNLSNMPSASKLLNTFSGSSNGGASIGNLWKALNLKGLVKNPYAKYGLPAAGAGYAVGPAAVESAKSVPSAVESVNLYPSWMRNLSNINETPFSVTTGDRASLEQAGLFGLDAAKQSLGHMAYKGLNSFSDSNSLPYNPLAYLPNSQASRSITKTLAGKAAPFLEQYSQPPDYEKLYTSYLANRHGIQEGGMAGKVSIPGLPSFSLNNLSPYLSQGYKDVVNSALVPSPVKVTANPQYLKEVMNKSTPNIGEAIYDSMFKSKNNAADETNFYKRLQEINSKPVSFTDIGRKYNTPPVQTREPQLRQSMSNMAKTVGNTISDKLIPPRPLGQKAPTMFPQISKYTDKLPW